MIFKNREEAGEKLSQKLQSYKNSSNTIIIGLPRGGVVVAAKIAQVLNLPLDIIVTRKLSDPFNPELAIGAITQEGKTVLDEKIIDMYGIEQDYIERQKEKEKAELKRRLKLYRADRSPLNLKNKIAILVDDGIATGATMKAAIKSAKAKQAEKVIVAVPVCPPEIAKEIENEGNKVICLQIPETLFAVGEFYVSFPQIQDKQITELLQNK